MGKLRETFFGSKLRGAITVVGVLAVLVVGAFVTGVLGAPSVVGVENRFGTVNETHTTILTDLTVDNPNPIGVTLGGTSVNYTVRMNDVSMASGSKKGIGIETGNTTLAFTTLMENEKIPRWWVSHIDNGERTQLELDAKVHSSLLGQTVTVPYSQEITTDVISQFNSEETRPVNANRPLIEDPVLYINETSAAWGSVSQSGTPIDMAFTVYNPKQVSYTITEIGYNITMNDVQVGEGTTSEPYVIEAKNETTIEAATAIRSGRLDEWWVSHLERNQVTNLRIDFYARVELPVGETIRIPLDELAYEQRIGTDFFGTKPEASPESASGSQDPTPEGAEAAGGTETSAIDGDVEVTAVPSPGTVTNGNGTVVPGVGSEGTATPTNSTDDDGLLDRDRGPVQ